MNDGSRGGLARRASRRLSLHPRAALGVTISGPLAWLLIVYIGSLALLVVSAFFSVDEFTGESTGSFTLDNLTNVVSKAVYRSLVFRSVLVGVAVTVVCIALALPTALYVSRLARPRTKRALIVAMLLPLWAGYLVKVYAIRAMLDPGSDPGSGGFLSSVVGWSPGFGYPALVITLAYLWFPYMVLPIYTALERMPNSLLDAAADLGAGTWRTLRSVVMPVLLPSIAAGSIFTFSLSLGDYISVKVVGGTSQMIGNIIERTLLAPNQPLAAAFTLWPILIMTAFLWVMGRLGAFENL